MLYWSYAGEKKIDFYKEIVLLSRKERNFLREAYFQPILPWEGIYIDISVKKRYWINVFSHVSPASVSFIRINN